MLHNNNSNNNSNNNNNNFSANTTPSKQIAYTTRLLAIYECLPTEQLHSDDLTQTKIPEDYSQIVKSFSTLDTMIENKVFIIKFGRFTNVRQMAFISSFIKNTGNIFSSQGYFNNTFIGHLDHPNNETLELFSKHEFIKEKIIATLDEYFEYAKSILMEEPGSNQSVVDTLLGTNTLPESPDQTIRYSEILKTDMQDLVTLHTEEIDGITLPIIVIYFPIKQDLELYILKEELKLQIEALISTFKDRFVSIDMPNPQHIYLFPPLLESDELKILKEEVRIEFQKILLNKINKIKLNKELEQIKNQEPKPNFSSEQINFNQIENNPQVSTVESPKTVNINKISTDETNQPAKRPRLERQAESPSPIKIMHGYEAIFHLSIRWNCLYIEIYPFTHEASFELFVEPIIGFLKPVGMVNTQFNNCALIMVPNLVQDLTLILILNVVLFLEKYKSQTIGLYSSIRDFQIALMVGQLEIYKRLKEQPRSLLVIQTNNLFLTCQPIQSVNNLNLSKLVFNRLIKLLKFQDNSPSISHEKRMIHLTYSTKIFNDLLENLHMFFSAQIQELMALFPEPYRKLHHIRYELSTQPVQLRETLPKQTQPAQLLPKSPNKPVETPAKFSTEPVQITPGQVNQEIQPVNKSLEKKNPTYGNPFVTFQPITEEWPLDFFGTDAVNKEAQQPEASRLTSTTTTTTTQDNSNNQQTDVHEEVIEIPSDVILEWPTYDFKK